MAPMLGREIGMSVVIFYLGCINWYRLSEGNLVSYQKITCAFRIRKFNFWESILRRYSNMVYKNKEREEKTHKCPSVGGWLCKCCYMEISDCFLMLKNWEKCLNTNTENHSRYTLKNKIKSQNNTVPFKWKQEQNLCFCICEERVLKINSFDRWREACIRRKKTFNFYLT